MTGKIEKARRKAIRSALRQEQRESVRNSLPIAPAQMKALFDYVDSQLSSLDCDDTLRFVREFIEAQGLPEDKTIAWLATGGGHCDCEVLDNVEEIFDDAFAAGGSSDNSSQTIQ